MNKLNIRNKKINNRSRKDLLPYLDLLYNDYQTDYPVNKYGLGSAIKGAFKDAFSADGLKAIAGAGIGSLGSVVGNIGGGLISGGKSSGVGNAIGNIGGTIGGAIGAVNPVAGAIVGAASGVLGGITNTMFGSKLNEKRIALAENEINAVKSFNADASNFDDLSLLIASTTGIANFSKSDIGSDGWFSNKAKNKYRELLKEKEFAEAWQRNSIVNNATNLQLNLIGNLLLNYAAYGGGIHIKPENRGKFTALKERTGKSATWFKEHGTPALKKMAIFALNSRKWEHKDGGLLNDYSNYINDTYNPNMEKVSKLFAGGGNLEGDREANTPLGAIVPKEYLSAADLAYAGLEFTPYVDSALGVIDVGNDLYNMYKNRDISLRSMGNLLFDSMGLIPGVKTLSKASDIARAHKKSFGGNLISNGVVWDNGVTVVNTGGTHELSPYEGVLMGVDPQGIPNLVEEGEVIWNDYVFSNRIPVPNAVRSKYKLRGTKNMTFADAAKKASKESEEMPNDNITLRGLLDIMSKLAYEQEVIRELRNMNNKNKFKGGGPKYTKQQVGLAAWDAYLSSLKNDDNNVLLRRPSASRFYDTTTLKPLDKIPSLLYYNLTRQSNNKTYNNNDDDLLDRDNLLRYAPVVGSAIGLGQTLFNKPDYSRADALALFAQNAGKITPISYDPLGNYLTYRPKDIDYIANKMAALAAATRRGIMNTSGGNRAMALAGLAALDYSSLLALAEAIRQADESNFNRGILVESFNRGTNQYNSEAALKAAMANQEARLKASQLGLSGYSTAMLMKDAIDALRNASINANLTNLFDSLGQIGEEIYDKNRLKWMERKGVLRSDYFDTGKYRKKYGGHINKGGK